MCPSGGFPSGVRVTSADLLPGRCGRDGDLPQAPTPSRTPAICRDRVCSLSSTNAPEDGQD